MLGVVAILVYIIITFHTDQIKNQAPYTVILVSAFFKSFSKITHHDS